MSHPAIRTLVVVDFTIDFAGESQHVTITAWGIADLAGLRRLSCEFKSDPRFRPGLKVLVDYSDLDMSQLSALDLEQIGVESLNHHELRSSAIAMVASDLKTYVRVREGVAQLGGSREKRQAFTSLGAAALWLGEQS